MSEQNIIKVVPDDERRGCCARTCQLPKGALIGIWVHSIMAFLLILTVIIVGSIMGPPTYAGKPYQETMCTTIGNWTYYYDEVIKEGGCCPKVHVNFTVPKTGDAEGFFYNTDYELYHLNKQCSYSCSDAEDAKQWLQDLYAKEAPFDCFYNPDNGMNSDVFGRRQFSFNGLFHATFWPAFSLLQSLIWMSCAASTYHKWRKANDMKCVVCC